MHCLETILKMNAPKFQPVTWGKASYWFLIGELVKEAVESGDFLPDDVIKVVVDGDEITLSK